MRSHAYAVHFPIFALTISPFYNIIEILIYKIKMEESAMSTLQIIGAIMVVVFGLSTFFVKKVLAAIYKQQPDDMQIVRFKTICLTLVFIGALMVYIPDMMGI